MVGLVVVTVFAVGGVFAVPAAVSSPDYQASPPGLQPNQPQQYLDIHLLTQASTSGAGASTTTAPVATPAVLAATAVVPAPAPAPASAAPAIPAVPAVGQATAWGCSAALAYLQVYAAPGFTLDCPGYAEGHEAMTCVHDTPAYPDACPNGPTIAISDACPQAYMNESANSWNLTGQLTTEQQKFGVSYAEIDPFGACP
jgi:hypothetical protein